MAREFDPIAVRRAFDTFDLQFELTREKSRFLPNAVGNAAVGGISTVISAWLVGLRREIYPALLRYGQWLEDSVTRNEQFGDHPEFAASRRSLAIGIFRWLRDSKNDPSSFSSAATSLHSAWGAEWNAEGAATSQDRREAVADYAALCLQCGAYADASNALLDLNAKSSRNDSRIKSDPACLALHFAERYVGGFVPTHEVDPVVVRCLNSNMSRNWLAHGQFLRAASWLKVVYWDTGLVTDPHKVILKAYEHMPSVTKPPFVESGS